MNDSISYNRSLISKSKREPFSRDESRYYEKHSEGEPVDVTILNGIVSSKIRQKTKGAWLIRLCLIVLVATLSGLLVYSFVVGVYASQPVPSPYENPDRLFETRILPLNDSLEFRSYYYKHGTKAGQTFYSHGRKHLQSEAYYPTGEPFRLANYYYDTLVTDVYLYHNGDTIRNMPSMEPGKVYAVTLPASGKHPPVSFDCFDGKIILGTYHKKNLPRR